MSDTISIDDIFRPLGSAPGDDIATWIDPNGRVLSNRIWLAKETTRDQIDRVLKMGIVGGQSPSVIARMLEQFLSPSWAAKRDEAGRLIQNQPKQIVTNLPYSLGAGSYPARRVARTELTRAFGRATIDAARRNRFVKQIAWRLSSAHRESDVCNDNAAFGPYDKDNVPDYPGHPHCLCTLVPVHEDTDVVIEQIRRERGRP
jgi:hypothetical protein